MAIDTAAKRRRAIGGTIIPDGEIAVEDRAQILEIYYMAAAATTVPPWRTLTVPLQGRTLTVPLQGRTLNVAFQSRTLYQGE